MTQAEKSLEQRLGEVRLQMKAERGWVTLPPLNLPSAEISELSYEDWVGPLEGDVWEAIGKALAVGTNAADEFISTVRARSQPSVLSAVLHGEAVPIDKLRTEYLRTLEWAAEMEGSVRALPRVMGALLTLAHQVQASPAVSLELSTLMQSLGSKGGEANALAWRQIERHAVSLASERWEAMRWRSASQAANDIQGEVAAYAASLGRAFVSGGQDKIAEWLRNAGLKRGYAKVGTSGQ